MSERDTPEGEGTWKLHEVAASLHTSLDHCDDIVRGRGYRLMFPEVVRTTPTVLELYPERLIARYRTHLVDLDLAYVRQIDPLVDKIRIDAGDDQTHATIVVEAKGAVTFTVTPERAEAAITTAEPTPASGEPVVSEAKAKETGQPPESEQPRVNLVGRVGAEPIFRTTPKGVVVGKFPLAVREGANKTSWHTILAFGPRALKLEEAVKKGDAVEVIGYKHLREFTKRDGSKKTVEEIYAVLVKNR